MNATKKKKKPFFLPDAQIPLRKADGSPATVYVSDVLSLLNRSVEHSCRCDRMPHCPACAVWDEFTTDMFWDAP